MKLNKTIEDKIKRHIEYNQKAMKVRDEITEWFANKGIDSSEEDPDMNLINDMLIDGSSNGDVENTINLINKILEEQYPHIK